MPVVMNARRASQKTVCMSNLRQIYIGWTLYLNDYHCALGEPTCWSSKVQHLEIYTKERAVWLCPLDVISEGVFHEQMEYNTSYFYVKRTIVDDILKVDANPGVFACMLHEKCHSRLSRIFPICWGARSVLRVHLDGSVRPARFYPICRYGPSGERVGFGIGWWLLFTDQFCMPSFHRDFCENWTFCHPRDIHW
jgi:hypothetical protein